MADIKERMLVLKCECGEQYSVKRNLSDDVEHLECNWCPLCRGNEDEEYVEKKIYKTN